MAAPPSLTRFAWLSIGASLATIALKTVAWRLTGSVGLLSDALESLVNLVAATMTLSMLVVAQKPPTEEHAYGYGKAEYFASGVEGALILLAAVAIGWTAIGRLMHPASIEQVGVGLLVSAAASIVNLVVARVLLAAGKRHHSIALEADAHHLMTDVWTSVGVVVGVGAVALTGWDRLDPIIAVLVALNIVWTGFGIMRRSALGLLDRALPAEEQELIRSGSPLPRSSSTRCAPARRGPAASSRCTCWSRAAGRCSAATSSWSASRRSCAARSPTPRSSPTSSRWRTRPPSPTWRSIGARAPDRAAHRHFTRRYTRHFR